MTAREQARLWAFCCPRCGGEMPNADTEALCFLCDATTDADYSRFPAATVGEAALLAAGGAL